MAKRCDICGKGPGFGNKISHAHNLSARRWNPNLQRVRVKIGNTTKRLNVCTSCLKSGKIEKAI
ncbi:MAG: 50S ribosomal protein L28 [bacterium]